MPPKVVRVRPTLTVFRSAAKTKRNTRNDAGTGDDENSDGGLFNGGVPSQISKWRPDTDTGHHDTMWSPSGAILVSVDGDFSPPNGVVFALAAFPPDSDALYAASANMSGLVGSNFKFGEEGQAFKSKPLSDHLTLGCDAQG
eukprot:2281801-Rhodomonas_salina.2